MPKISIRFIKTLKNIDVRSYTNKTGDSSVNLYDIFKMGSGITSVKNQFLVTGVKFNSKDPNHLSLFMGFPYHNNNNIHNPLPHSIDHIKPFLDCDQGH
jgi:hypothetical protein